MLKEGSSGPQVVDLQKALGINADGIFGAQTRRAVMSFQVAHGLFADGIVGALTEAALRRSAPPADHPDLPPISHPSGKGPLKGLDIYHGDDIASWSKLAQNNSFIFMKASDGVSSRDSKFKEYWQAARAHGMIRGAYHFAQWGAGSGKDQAHNFWNAIKAAGGMDEHDLPPCFDFEYYPERSGRASDAPVAKTFLEEIQSLSGRRPIVYVNSSTADEVGSPSWLKEYPLWVASYRSKPKLPSLWKDWTFWQFGESVSIPGLGNKGDGDYYNGDLDDLKSFIAKSFV